MSDDSPCFEAVRAGHVEQAARSPSFALLELPGVECSSRTDGHRRSRDWVSCESRRCDLTGFPSSPHPLSRLKWSWVPRARSGTCRTKNAEWHSAPPLERFVELREAAIREKLLTNVTVTSTWMRLTTIKNAMTKNRNDEKGVNIYSPEEIPNNENKKWSLEVKMKHFL